MSSGTGAAVEEVGHSMAPSEAAKTAAIKGSAKAAPAQSPL